MEKQERRAKCQKHIQEFQQQEWCIKIKTLNILKLIAHMSGCEGIRVWGRWEWSVYLTRILT